MPYFGQDIAIKAQAKGPPNVTMYAAQMTLEGRACGG